MNILNKTVTHRHFGIGTVAAVEDGCAGRVRVNFRGCGDKIFTRESFARFCFFFDPDEQAEFESELEDERKNAEAAAAEAAAEQNAALAEAAAAEAALAEKKLRAVFKGLEMRARKEAQRLEKRKAREAAEAAAAERFEAAYESVCKNVRLFVVNVDGTEYCSTHRDRLVSESEFETIACLLCRGYRAFYQMNPLDKYCYSPDTVRKLLVEMNGTEFSPERAWALGSDLDVLYLSAISYLHHAHPGYADVAGLFEAYSQRPQLLAA